MTTTRFGPNNPSPNAYTEEERSVLLQLLFVRIAGGQTLTAFCEQTGMPSAARMKYWIDQSPELQRAYYNARQHQADHLAEETIDIADGSNNTTREVDRLRIEARRWFAAKIKPKVYGEKFAVGGADDLPPMRTIDATQLSTETLRQIAQAMNAEPDPQ